MRALLQTQAAAMGVTLDNGTAEKLLAYLDLLEKWNRTFNLTAIRQREMMLTHHLLDSLSVLPHLQGVHRLADIGSGAGLPGIPLAIVCPEMAVALIEASQKKSAFQQQARIDLQLPNLTVINQRVEAVTAEPSFDAVISRAFSDVDKYVRLTSHLIHENGRYLAMKGVIPEAELSGLKHKVNAEQIIPLHVPGLGAERHLIILRKT